MKKKNERMTVTDRQKRRFKAVVRLQEFIKEISEGRQMVITCEGILEKLNLCVEKLTEKETLSLIDQAMATLHIGQAIGAFGRTIRCNKARIENNQKSLREILPMLNGESVEGWERVDFGKSGHLSESLMLSIFNGETIDVDQLIKYTLSVYL